MTPQTSQHVQQADEDEREPRKAPNGTLSDQSGRGRIHDDEFDTGRSSGEKKAA
jgi:hypothetical protein